MKKLTLIGDSIRMGYQQTVHQMLSDEYEIWQPEENGGNSRNVLSHINEWLINQPADVIHINCGLHDLRKEYGSNEPAIDLIEYEENLIAIFTRIKTETKAQIIWASTTPVNQKWHHETKGFDRFEADVDAYNEVATRVATKINIPIDDLYTVVVAVGRDNIILPDGVHFTSEGYNILGNAVVKFIKSKL
jgi:lysophospholipase L1-like esterase